MDTAIVYNMAGPVLTPCQQVQADYRQILIDSIGVAEVKGRWFMTATWTDWFQVLSRKPTDGDLDEFIEMAMGWPRT